MKDIVSMSITVVFKTEWENVISDCAKVQKAFNDMGYHWAGEGSTGGTDGRKVNMSFYKEAENEL